MGKNIVALFLWKQQQLTNLNKTGVNKVHHGGTKTTKIELKLTSQNKTENKIAIQDT